MLNRYTSDIYSVMHKFVEIAQFYNKSKRTSVIMFSTKSHYRDISVNSFKLRDAALDPNRRASSGNFSNCNVGCLLIIIIVVVLMGVHYHWKAIPSWQDPQPGPALFRLKRSMFAPQLVMCLCVCYVADEMANWCWQHVILNVFLQQSPDRALRRLIRWCSIVRHCFWNVGTANVH